MLSARLEQMIWEDKAQYLTWNIGSGAANIDVKDNECIIITDIDYFPFIDSNQNDFLSDTAWHKNMNKEIVISSPTKRHVYLVRNYFNRTTQVQCAKYHWDTYMPFSDNITAAIFTIPTTSTPWTFGTGTAPPESKAKRPPLSIGTSADANALTVVRATRFAAPNEARAFKAVRAGATFDESFDDFQVSAQASTQTIPPVVVAANTGNQQFPMMTISYVKIPKNLAQVFA